MPVTPEQAVSAALRGTIRSFEEAPPEPDLEQFQEFLRHVHRQLQIVDQAVVEACSVPADGACARIFIENAYVRALGLAMGSLLALAHFPLLEEIAEPLPGEKLE